MAKPYSNDSRVRLTAASFRTKLGQLEFAAESGVSEASLRRFRRRFRETGTAERVFTRNKKRYFDEVNGALLVEITLANPLFTLPDLVELWELSTGIRMSRSSVSAALCRLGISKKTFAHMPRRNRPIGFKEHWVISFKK